MTASIKDILLDGSTFPGLFIESASLSKISFMIFPAATNKEAAIAAIK